MGEHIHHNSSLANNTGDIIVGRNCFEGNFGAIPYSFVHRTKGSFTDHSADINVAYEYGCIIVVVSMLQALKKTSMCMYVRDLLSEQQRLWKTE
jgi:hypothetical protein